MRRAPACAKCSTSAVRQLLNTLIACTSLQGPQGTRGGAGLRQGGLGRAGERIIHIVPGSEGKRATEYRERLARALAQGSARGRVAKDH